MVSARAINYDNILLLDLIGNNWLKQSNDYLFVEYYSISFILLNTNKPFDGSHTWVIAHCGSSKWDDTVSRYMSYYHISNTTVMIDRTIYYNDKCVTMFWATFYTVHSTVDCNIPITLTRRNGYPVLSSWAFDTDILPTMWRGTFPMSLPAAFGSSSL